MSLLDDARTLYDEYMDEDNDDPGDAAAHYTELHPRIIAVLEAAERLVASGNLIEEGEGTLKWHCLSCEAIQEDWSPFHPTPFPHTPECLTVAMNGDVVPQESETATS